MIQMIHHALRLSIALSLSLCTAIPLTAQNYAQEVGEAEVDSRTTDSTLTQEYTGNFGWKIFLPEESIAKYNKLGSKVNESGQSEVVNFMLRGRRGGISIRYYTEQRMIPLGYKLLDSTLHFYEIDSVGRNGNIYRRTYVMTDQAVEIEIMLTEKGDADLKEKVEAMFDSFLPPETARMELEEWRYGRDPSDYEEGRYPPGGGPE